MTPMQRTRPLQAAALFIVVQGAVGNAIAQDYPNRVVRIVVADTAGSSGDNGIRLLAQKLTAEWGQQVIVDNRPGANGIIGAEAVAKARPDGYTLLNGTPSMLTMNRIVYKSLPYDSLRDFAPVSQLTTNHFALVVNPALPVRSVAELVKLARARPGEMLYASAGVGNQNHLSCEMFARATGLQLRHIPHKGTNPALISLLAGEVAMMITSASAVAPQIAAGRMRLLATAGTERTRAFPNAPTLVEAGYPDVVVMGWSGLIAPAGIPAEIAARIARDVARVLSTPESRAALSDQGRDVTPTPPEAFGAWIRREADRWAKAIRAVGLEHSQ